MALTLFQQVRVFAENNFGVGSPGQQTVTRSASSTASNIGSTLGASIGSILLVLLILLFLGIRRSQNRWRKKLVQITAEHAVLGPEPYVILCISSLSV